MNSLVALVFIGACHTPEESHTTDLAWMCQISGLSPNSDGEIGFDDSSSLGFTAREALSGFTLPTALSSWEDVKNLGAESVPALSVEFTPDSEVAKVIHENEACEEMIFVEGVYTLSIEGVIEEAPIPGLVAFTAERSEVWMHSAEVNLSSSWQASLQAYLEVEEPGSTVEYISLRAYPWFVGHGLRVEMNAHVLAPGEENPGSMPLASADAPL